MIDSKLISSVFFGPRGHVIGVADFIKVFLDLFGEIILILTAGRSIIKFLLLFHWTSIFLLILHFLGEFCLDDGKGEIQKEESADKDDRIEVYKDPGAH
jgi:hypothetical protein